MRINEPNLRFKEHCDRIGWPDKFSQIKRQCMARIALKLVENSPEINPDVNTLFCLIVAALPDSDMENYLCNLRLKVAEVRCRWNVTNEDIMEARRLCKEIEEHEARKTS